ncbi:MAG: alkaline phosphatase PhoX [Planctomycetota bacterium]
MPTTRRHFLRTSAAYAAGFAGLRALEHPALAAATAVADGSVGYGDLVADPAGLLDLPTGFSYRVVSRTGDRMDDGLLVSAAPDGMATFAGPDGLTLLVRNHETRPGMAGPFGDGDTRLTDAVRAKLYDDGGGVTPGVGGTTTVVYDTRSQRVVRQFQSLAGTERNCAGGPTPWGSWITCEETTDRPGALSDPRDTFTIARDHGYNFEVPATATPSLADPTPLVAMGRMRHEAVAVHPSTGVVFQTEDIDDGAIYRFLPNRPSRGATPGDLAAGGRLQALAVIGRPSLDTRNWESADVAVGDRLAVRWIDLDHPESPDDDLRYRAFEAGAARFARGEGMWHVAAEDSLDGDLYFACTSGGAKRIGQIWRYTPSLAEGQAGEADAPGALELFFEPNDSRLIENADNLTAAPWGDLVVCEDRQGDVVRLVGVTPTGRCYTLARNHVRGEFAGVTFSPDGSTLFVNLQTAGMTVAITGPWG